MEHNSGSLYVKASSTHKSGWRVMKQFFVGKKRVHKTVRKAALRALGFAPTMTLDEARARASQLNSGATAKRNEAMTITRIADRVERDKLFHAAYVPEAMNERFLAWLDANTTGKAKYKDKQRIHWASSKKVIIALKLQPSEYEINKKQFYQYFALQTYSYSYTQKLIRTINQYGIFVCRLTGQYFEEIPGPRGHDREMINDSYFDSDSYFGPSEPLTVAILGEIQSGLPEEQYNWLFCTVWLGLRPSELNLILSEKQIGKHWRLEEGEIDVLWVYQPKLTAKPRHLRWKPIPLVYPEQKAALGMLYGGLGAAKPPLTKTLKRLTGAHITLYGGRKGFTDLMLDRGHRLEDIAQWLGHSSIQRTWSHYKDRTNVSYLKTRK